MGESSSLTGPIPEEEVIAAIERQGYTVSVASIVKETGLDTDVVEAELALLLRLSRGFFEVCPQKEEKKGREYLLHSWFTRQSHRSHRVRTYTTTYRAVTATSDQLYGLLCLVCIDGVDQAIEDIKTEAGQNQVIPVKLDVTKEDQVQALAEQVDKENPQGLWALVNNAGVSRSGLIDWMAMSDFRFCMEINFFSVISVTKTFLPLIKKSKGRIVIMSSSSGVSCGYALTGAYSASKHAADLFASTLRQEMKAWGITVCTINPGFHKTGINLDSSKIMQGVWEKIPDWKKEQYGEPYLKSTIELQQAFTQGLVFDPKNVVKAYIHAISSTRPLVQYRVGVDSKFIFPWTQIFPLRIGELMTYYASTNKGMRKIAKPYQKRDIDQATAAVAVQQTA